VPVLRGDRSAVTQLPSSTSTLILDCPSCADPSKAGEPWRQADGLREWVADFEPTASTNDAGWCWWPIEGEQALHCPDCGELGRIYAY
jgi:hypothetical protein